MVANGLDAGRVVEFLRAGQLVLIGREGAIVGGVERGDELIAIREEGRVGGPVGGPQGSEDAGQIDSVLGGDPSVGLDLGFLIAEGEGLVEFSGLGGGADGAVESGDVVAVQGRDGGRVFGRDLGLVGGEEGLLQLGELRGNRVGGC